MWFIEWGGLDGLDAEGGGGWFVLCIELFEAIYIHLDILKLRVEGNDFLRKLF